MKNRANYGSGRSMLPLILVLVGLLLLAGVFAWQGSNAGKVNAGQELPQTAGPSDSLTPAPEIKRVPLEEAKAAFDSQSAVFVDVRSAETYNQGHIPGAINIPLAEMATRASELDPNQWIITYCT
jgi:3-mercaptopyruvate sulfurtransferase SseA